VFLGPFRTASETQNTTFARSASWAILASASSVGINLPLELGLQQLAAGEKRFGVIGQQRRRRPVALQCLGAEQMAHVVRPRDQDGVIEAAALATEQREIGCRAIVHELRRVVDRTPYFGHISLRLIHRPQALRLSTPTRFMTMIAFAYLQHRGLKAAEGEKRIVGQSPQPSLRPTRSAHRAVPPSPMPTMSLASSADTSADLPK
jgi:hypothetical protein